MSNDQPWYEDVALPALLRGARATYGSAIRAALGQAGCHDVPRNGIYVVGAIARGGSPLAQIIRELGVSKQAGGQLVDTLVVRGYLDRSPDPEDRRRMIISLTERGRAAAAAAQSAVRRIDKEVTGLVGTGSMAQTRATLAALVELGRGHRG